MNVTSRSLVPTPVASKGRSSAHRLPVTALPRRMISASRGVTARNSARKRAYLDRSPAKARRITRSIVSERGSAEVKVTQPGEARSWLVRSAAPATASGSSEALRNLHHRRIDLCRFDVGHLHRARIRCRALRVFADDAGRLEFHDGALEQLLVEREHLVPFTAQ